jgi:hypothetical protein
MRNENAGNILLIMARNDKVVKVIVELLWRNVDPLGRVHFVMLVVKKYRRANFSIVETFYDLEQSRYLAVGFPSWILPGSTVRNPQLFLFPFTTLED